MTRNLPDDRKCEQRTRLTVLSLIYLVHRYKLNSLIVGISPVDIVVQECSVTQNRNTQTLRTTLISSNFYLQEIMAISTRICVE